MVRAITPASVDFAKWYTDIVQAAELADAARVGCLLLVHISRRYSKREIVREARAIFPNTIVPRDLDRFRVTKGEVQKVVEDDAH